MKIDTISPERRACLRPFELVLSILYPLWKTPTRKEESEYLKYAEQRWFAGAHGNVGGGYGNDELALIPLARMQHKAIRAGLNFKDKVIPPENAFRGKIYDSYKEFGSWLIKYRWAVRRRYFRVIKAKRIGGHEDELKNDEILARHHQLDPGRVNETIDVSVLQRISEFEEYRPPAIKSSLEEIDGQRYSQLILCVKNEFKRIS